MKTLLHGTLDAASFVLEFIWMIIEVKSSDRMAVSGIDVVGGRVFAENMYVINYFDYQLMLLFVQWWSLEPESLSKPSSKT